MSKIKIKQPIFFISLILAVVVFVLFIAPLTLYVSRYTLHAQAATLSFSPSSGSYEVGQTFSVGIYVASTDEAMNAVSGMLAFPADKLEILSLSKAGSIISLWVQEPLFVSGAGSANFEGIVLNPGFSGASGKIISLSFKVKAAGSANLNFATASVLANDGQGTNILTSLGTANFILSVPVMAPGQPPAPSQPAAPSAPAPTTGTPSAPEVKSATHPDPDEWSSAPTAKFSWPLPQDATAVRLLVGKIPQAVPTVIYKPAINSKDLTDLEDGVWYFHVQIKNAKGWGAISHFRFQTDTIPPEPFSITLVDGKETDNPRPTALFETKDALSGIAYYKVKIGDGDFFTLAESALKHNPYTLPYQAPGKHTLLVQAFDRAGNNTIATEEFIIKPLATPHLTDYPQELLRGEVLVIKGTAPATTTLTLYLANEKGEVKTQQVKVNEAGNFTLIYQERLAVGVYTLWAEAEDERGAKSLPSERVTTSVVLPRALKIGKIAIDYLMIIGTLIVLIVGMLGLILWLIFRIRFWRRRLRRETNESLVVLYRAFEALREEVEVQIALFDGKRDLNAREKEICDRLKKSLRHAEKSIGKEIKDIEKMVK